MNSCCKVGRVIEEYNLQDAVQADSVDEYLLRRWNGTEDYPETGLRPLRDWFNKKIIETTYEEHEVSIVDSRLKSDYQTLDSGEELERQGLLDELEAKGIDSEELISNLISTSTLYRHLTNCLEGNKERDEAKRSNWQKERVEYVEDIVEENMQEIISSLGSGDSLYKADDIPIKTQIIVECPVCGTQSRIEKVLRDKEICSEHAILTESSKNNQQ
ncbi:hypothetical protein K0C01_05495 [Salinarchaeum sp. IM2453]|uniref:rod-determining factor RdfA n=1 Tax=Salinarchaeum sp. IM2453 TaxID=2862870 RepID=UPI001C83F4D1|nr:rod-determining factor RdfA [Salinarchaeum sp. IM2453]QZA89585.1 hypothetical protein K0C01_05495 [Salinarchaeum sp. IM2453]